MPTIVGSIIGYVTNWLAIKMLFRPHNEIRIFNLKLPFTPGLIPKERARIANSIGSSISDYLLTKEELTEALSNEKMSQNIDKWILNFILDIKNSKKIVKDIIIDLNPDIYDELILYINSKAFDMISEKLDNEKSRKELLSKFEYKFNEILDDRNSKELILNIIEKQIEVYKNDNRSVAEVLTDERVKDIKQYIYENREMISERIFDLLKKVEIRRTLKTGIAEIIKKHIPKMLLMIITEDMMADKVYDELMNYIQAEESKDKIAFGLNSIVDNVLETNISHVVSELSDNISNEDLYNIVDKNLRNVVFSNKESIFSNLMEKIKEQLRYFIKDIVDNIMNREISSVLNDLNDDKTREISELFKEKIISAIIDKGPMIIEELDIANIVEDKINHFDVQFTEDLILSIADRELKAITWLGALLGAIMGFAGSIF